MEIDTEDLLDNWYKTKQEISILEKKCEKYKKVAEKLMSQTQKNTLKSTSYSLKKIDISKHTISKNDVPDEIWNKYSKRTSYSSFYLNINDKNKKSPRKKPKKSI